MTRTDLSGAVDVAGHDTDLAALGVDDTGAVGAHEAGLGLGLESVGDLWREAWVDLRRDSG